ncbi:MAG: ABC transporter ATP-binding protein [Pseudomonadota bacterium]
MSQHAALVVRDLGRTFDRKPALSGVSLRLEPGEITAVVGGSGAGKTTLLRLIAGMEKPDAGTITSAETVLSSAHHVIPPEKRHIGLIFQDFALFPHLNVIQNIGFGLSKHDKMAAENTIQLWLERLSLEHRRTAFPHQLSGGEQQRVAIARALAANPVAILMDEPFSGLDPTLRADIRHLALGAVKDAKIPALLVTHDPAEALAVADQIMILDRGFVVQSGTPDALYRAPLNAIAARALGPVIALDIDDTPPPWRAESGHQSRLCFRPEHVRVSTASGVLLRVIGARRVGPIAQITLKTGESSFTAHMMLDELPRVGENLPVELIAGSAFSYQDANSDKSVT